ncbi:hypothetical protein V2A60_005891 [Cordyceps javanica]|uniref:Arabinan endo-1,5-alpha-L-arabinosidase A n=1 Tax=Cordyceps javanica TaxID=43265 RepID=A0A545VYG5_9HYPO|nr:arabinan endo-1,5-alpha-L-arabinosidase A [Cordyceps javanica]TQW06744.1 arabinan endo-1,5-alpha-L-arabinosidase A [Cordyceps javanica]
MPYDGSTVKDCAWWYDSDGSDSCVDVPKLFGISQRNFVKWNPSITPDCGNFKTGQSYCVEAAVATTTNQPTPTATPVGPTNGIETPQPTQSEITRNCNRFHMVQPNDTCVGIASRNGIAQADVAVWNPSANSDCSGLRAYLYACTSVLEQWSFGKYKFAGWSVVGGGFSLSSTLIEAEVSEGGKAMIDTTYTDVSMQMIVIFRRDDPSSGNLGFVLRASEVGVGSDNYRGYYVGLDRAAGGVVIGRADKAWQQLQFVPATIGDFATLKVQMTGDRLTVYLNNLSRPLTTLSDGTYRQGQVGLRTYKKAASIGALVVSPLVYEGFERQLAGWTVYDGYFNASHKLLVGMADGGDGSDGGASGKATMNTNFTDFILEAEILLTKDGPGTAGVLFRASSLGRGLNSYKGYYLGLASDGTIVLGRGDGKTWTEMQSTKVEAKVYHSYRIKVQAAGSRIEVYFEDMAKALMVTTDASYGSGMVGARLDHSTAIFYSFAVQRR